MAKMVCDPIKNTDGQTILEEILKWRAELDSSLIDSIIYETLDTVIDIIYENSECELNYENT